MANALLHDNVAGGFLFVFQGEDVFVTDRKDSSTEVQQHRGTSKLLTNTSLVQFSGVCQEGTGAGL